MILIERHGCSDASVSRLTLPAVSRVDPLGLLVRRASPPRTVPARRGDLGAEGGARRERFERRHLCRGSHRRRPCRARPGRSPVAGLLALVDACRCRDGAPGMRVSAATATRLLRHDSQFQGPAILLEGVAALLQDETGAADALFTSAAATCFRYGGIPTGLAALALRASSALRVRGHRHGVRAVRRRRFDRRRSPPRHARPVDGRPRGCRTSGNSAWEPRTSSQPLGAGGAQPTVGLSRCALQRRLSGRTRRGVRRTRRPRRRQGGVPPDQRGPRCATRPRCRDRSLRRVAWQAPRGRPNPSWAHRR